MLHWPIYQQPFLCDPLPLPDDDLYVSTATEIRDLTTPPGDGAPGVSWEATLPTTLMWLEDEAELPSNQIRRLGRPPRQPADPGAMTRGAAANATGTPEAVMAT